MEEIVSKKLCTGCSACNNICPKNAIKMKKDDEGFLFPIIDKEKCINCGLCQKTCPILNPKENTSINKCYAGYCKIDKITQKSSSGGIFPLIANKILEENGIVIGAAFDENNKLNHIAIEKKEELNKLLGSKYLQSDLNNIFDYVKKNIQNKKILFVGTPCQVAGLKAFLKKEHDNLITIDLFCHGVPSPKLFEKYIEYLEQINNDKVIKYNFRDKSTGWDTYSNCIDFKTKKIKELSNKNQYMNLFLSDNALRNSCYNCHFKLDNKYSDITLGDFWGIKKYYEELYNKNGVSAIIINTKKGMKILNIIKKELELKKCNINEILDGNPILIKSCKKTAKRETFYKDLNTMNFYKIYKKYRKKEPNIVKKIIKKIIRFIKKIGKMKNEKTN